MSERLPLGLALNLWDRMTSWSDALKIATRSECEPILEGIVPDRYRRG